MTSSHAAGPAWAAFPHPDKSYHYSAAALRKHWAQLHRGDCEPLPQQPAVLEAWRLHHAGDFQSACEAGLALGMDGWNAAHKAAMIHAHYLETDPAARLERLQAVARRCAEQQKARPTDANAFYLEAYALGRYSQGISVVQALAQGLGGRIRAALERALEIDERHADAHCALGAFQAEVIDKVGALVGRLSYGATRDGAATHCRRALELVPDSAIFAVEWARAMELLYGPSRRAEVQRLRSQAAAATALDAMERLDVELARSLVPG
ncbi:MAG: hypothetical protein KA896_17730 [Leptothrix sp. (in: Bacteria)]|nr:hypothetical protein [Leptothrix sp. (in: b-proteobacteria)]